MRYQGAINLSPSNMTYALVAEELVSALSPSPPPPPPSPPPPSPPPPPPPLLFSTPAVCLASAVAYVSTRQHTSAYVCAPAVCLASAVPTLVSSRLG